MFQTRTDANWQVTVELKGGLRYRFRYLVDGKEWVNDWHADDYFYDDAAPSTQCDSVVDLTQIDAPALLSLS
jgi:hypothetical protein